MSQSNGCLNTTMKLLAGFLAFFVVLTLPICVLIFDVSRVVFSPDILSEQLTSQLVASGFLRSYVTDQLLSPEALERIGPGDVDLVQILKDLSPGDREALVEIVLPQGWLEPQIAEVSKALSTWIDSDEAMPKLVLDIRPIKDRLMTGGAEEILETIIDSWPSCTLDQTAQLQESLQRSGDIPFLHCEPPEPFRERLTGMATEMLREFIREIPPDFVLAGEEIDSQDAAELMAMKEQIRLIRTLSRSIWLVPIALLGLVMALAIRSWGEFGRWWGIPLLLSGVIIFGYVLLMPIARELMLPRLLSDLRYEAEPLYEMAQMVINALIEVILGFLVIHAMFIGGIGLVILVVGWLIARRTATVKPEPPMARSPSTGWDTPAEGGPSSAHIPPQPPVSPMPEDDSSMEGPEE
jgi:hypothetical protein